MNTYAGIGSRKTPDDVLDLMSSIAYRLAGAWDLRTGGAEGADRAFALGALEAGGGLEVYLPWPDFNGFNDRDPDDQVVVALWKPQREARAIAERYHPAWANLSHGAKALHARNVHQVLGRDVTKPELSSRVICWTPGARGGGGTGQAIRVASAYGVQVLDLANGIVRAGVEAWLATDDEEGV